jgi:predicted metal-dependent enzyme (double-stranded beta helix superfamily)
MENSDWLVTDDGKCQLCSIPDDWEWTTKTYRLYRFLTDVEDILEQTQDEIKRLEAIRPLVRRLLTSSYWLQAEYSEPNPDRGWSVSMLYDEVNFPLTVQTVVWLPGKCSPIHNHATWGIVALIEGEEKNTLWRRGDRQEFPDEIEKVEEKILAPGDIISFTSDAIHSIEAISEEPTITFNIYGETNYDRRFEFDPIDRTKKQF